MRIVKQGRPGGRIAWLVALGLICGLPAAGAAQESDFFSPKIHRSLLPPSPPWDGAGTCVAESAETSDFAGNANAVLNRFLERTDFFDCKAYLSPMGIEY